MSENQTPTEPVSPSTMDDQTRKLYAEMLEADMAYHTTIAEYTKLNLIAFAASTPENIGRAREYKKNELAAAVKKMMQATNAFYGSPFSLRTKRVDLKVPQFSVRQLIELFRVTSDPFGEFDFGDDVPSSTDNAEPFDVKKFLNEVFKGIDHDEAVEKLNVGATKLLGAIQANTTTGKDRVLDALDDAADTIVDAFDTGKAKIRKVTSTGRNKLAERLATTSAE